MKHSTPAAPSMRRPLSPAPKVRKNLSPAQIRVLPLLCVFDACKAVGLTCTNENRDLRARNLNRYWNDVPGFDWVETFKDMIGNDAMIEATASAIREQKLTW